MLYERLCVILNCCGIPGFRGAFDKWGNCHKSGIDPLSFPIAHHQAMGLVETMSFA